MFYASLMFINHLAEALKARYKLRISKLIVQLLSTFFKSTNDANDESKWDT